MVKQKRNPIIVSWIGGTDLAAMNAWRRKNGLPTSDAREDSRYPGVEEAGHNGPVRTLTDAHEAERIYLLISRQYEADAENMRAWVKRGSKAACELVMTDLDNPTSYEEVYAAAEEFFRKHWSSNDANRYWYNLTPGTPAIQAIMLYLSQVRYAGGKAWRVVGPEHARDGRQVFEVRLPFRLPVESWRRGGGSLADERQLQEILSVYAPVRAVNILLLGESGVGKTYFARRIHAECGGDDANFVEVNCAELAAGEGNMFRAELFGAQKGAYTGAVKTTQGAFERARGGTLFLDEIGEIPLERQAILLRALQEKKIEMVGGGSRDVTNVRIIAATNRNLAEEVRAGRFRQDLFYRIAMCPVYLPPLRRLAANDEARFRQLVEDTLKDLGRDTQELDKFWTLDEDVWPLLRSYRWPGNVRELRHVLFLSCISVGARNEVILKKDDVERHLAFVEHLSALVAPEGQVGEGGDFLPDNLDTWLETKRAAFIERALQRTGNNRAAAARLLGIPYQRLTYYMERRGKSAASGNEC